MLDLTSWSWDIIVTILQTTFSKIFVGILYCLYFDSIFTSDHVVYVPSIGYVHIKNDLCFTYLFPNDQTNNMSALFQLF